MRDGPGVVDAGTDGLGVGEAVGSDVQAASRQATDRPCKSSLTKARRCLSVELWRNSLFRTLQHDGAFVSPTEGIAEGVSGRPTRRITHAAPYHPATAYTHPAIASAT